MKFLFDQNISYRVVNLLKTEFDVCLSVKDVGLFESNDMEIWKYCRDNGLTVVTQDDDFEKLYLLMGFPPKIIWVRTGNLPNAELAGILSTKKDIILEFIENPEAGILEIYRL